MKCVEVNELIQRNFDADLTEHEQKRLNQHIEICSDCKSFYQRLRHVHLDLENLPNVTLPFSIVDSLLPVLDRIDSTVIDPPSVLKQQLTKRWSSKNRWLRTITVVTASVVMVFAISQLVKPEQQQHASLEQENHMMQMSGFASMDATSTESPQSTIMMSETSEAALDQSNIDSEKFTSRAIEDGASKPSGISNSASPELADTNPIPTYESAGTELLTVGKSDVSRSNDMYGIAQDDATDKVVSVSPTFTGKNDHHEVVTLESPDHTLIAIYSGEFIEIKRSNEDSLVQIQAGVSERFSNLVWVNATQLQYSVHSAARTQTWMIDTSSGTSKILNEE